MEDKIIKDELDELLEISEDFELIEHIKEMEKPQKSTEELARNWYSYLEGVKFEDWGEELFHYSMPIKLIEVPSQLFIDCMNKKHNSEHILVNHLQRKLNKQENMFYWGDNHIKELFVKLETRSPKDYLQKYPKEEFEPVVNASDIVSALMGSMRTFEDLVFLTVLKDIVKIYIRPFVDTYKPFEWRAFVKDGELIGVSQQFYNNFYDYKESYLEVAKKSIRKFMNEVCIPNIKVKDFVADLYVDCSKLWVGGSDFYRVSIIETNPYGLSDPCLFKSYKELETTSINFRFS